MGKYFSDVVDKAIQDLDYCCDNDKAKAAADTLLFAIEIEDHKESDFANKGAWNAWKQLQIKQCLPWFERSFSGGMILAGQNYCHYYQHGRREYIPPELGKEVPIIRQGAERGYPEWMYTYANRLAYKEDNDKEALPWALKAAEAGHLWSWHIIRGYLLGWYGSGAYPVLCAPMLQKNRQLW